MRRKPQTTARRKPPPAANTKDFLVHDIPHELKTEFKAECARRNVTMREAVIDMMRGYLNYA